MMNAALFITLALTVATFTGLWLIHVALRDAGIIDYYWGPGFAVIGAVHVLTDGGASPMQWIFLLAVTAWAVRLALHLIARHLRSHGEDARYRAMRESGGPTYWWTSLFKVFLLQAVLLWIIATPVHLALGPASIDPPGGISAVFFWAGLIAFACGFLIEATADRQLAAAKAAQPCNALARSGLWAASRHPNYLGEMILWWGLGISAAALSGNVLALAGPALLSLVMVTVSIPLTEEHLHRSRPTYADYAQRVPRLLPRLFGRTEDGEQAT